MAETEQSQHSGSSLFLSFLAGMIPPIFPIAIGNTINVHVPVALSGVGTAQVGAAAAVFPWVPVIALGVLVLVSCAVVQNARAKRV